MSDTLVVCEVDPELVARIKKFRFRKETTNAAIILKCDKGLGKVVFEEEHEDISIEDLKDELPESQPRYVFYSYKHVHDDNRVSYPLCFIFSSPYGCKPDQHMMYAGSMKTVVQKLDATKTFELRNTEELTEEWLLKKLKLFR